ncbi:MAG: hypothetical protein ACLFP8_05200, partial [Alphaproteobacteria bacterium]
RNYRKNKPREASVGINPLVYYNPYAIAFPAYTKNHAMKENIKGPDEKKPKQKKPRQKSPDKKGSDTCQSL